MKIGISTACLFPMHTESSLEKLVELDCNNFEIFINSKSEFEAAFCKKLMGILKESGKEIIAVHPYTSELETTLFFTDYERRFAEGCELYRTFFEYTAEIGAKYLIFHGSRNKSVSNEFYCERFFRLAQIARSCGVKLLQENIERCKSGDIQLIQYLKKNCPEVGFAYDMKQEKRSGLEDMEVLKLMGHNIEHIHVSDRNEGSECLPAGQGDFDWDNLIAYLNGINYKGTLIEELYSDVCYPYSNITTSMKYLKEKVANG